MQITITRRTIVAAVAAMALVGAGGAIAASNAAGGSSGTAATAACGPGPGGPGARAGFLDAAATYLGVTQAELRTAHQNGTTLAQLAEQKGKTVAGLKAAILAGAKADLDKAVAAGRITAAQETTRLADLQSHLDDIVNGIGPPSGPPPAA
jgi:hypothetical protein